MFKREDSMLKTRLKLFIIIACLLFLSACGDKKLYKEAQESFEKGDYEKAKVSATALKNQYPNSKYASQTQEILQKVDSIEAEKQKEQKKQAEVRAGYKDAKWGMSPDEVKKALSMRVIREDKDFIAFDKVRCWFYKNRFYHAQYEPKLHDGDQKGFQAVVNALEEKFGSGKELKNQVDALLKTPLLVYLWEDELTTIRLWMWDPESWYKSGGDIFPSSTLSVIYESKELKAEKENEESQQEYSKMEKRKESIKDDL